MIKNFLLSVILMMVCFSATHVAAESLAVPWKNNERKLKVTRHYELPVQKGKALVARIPTLMSFWGQSNWQVVKTSQFKYSENPDKEATTTDSDGMPRKYLDLTWNAPKADKIVVDQTMDVELTCFGSIYTTAKLPYSDAVKARFAESLSADKNDDIDPAIKEIEPICADILKKSKDAEEAVEHVCNWINENITFNKGTRTTEAAIKEKKGSCTPMSRIACSMLRKIGMPAELLSAKFIGSDSGHCYIEVYFPDAGWILYDLSNRTRGFKSLDCIMTLGWGYFSGAPDKLKWTEGYCLTEKDAVPFKDLSDQATKMVRKAPAGMSVACANVVKSAAPPSVKSRHRPIRELILDEKIPAGPRENTDNVPGPIPAGK